LYGDRIKPQGETTQPTITSSQHRHHLEQLHTNQLPALHQDRCCEKTLGLLSAKTLSVERTGAVVGAGSRIAEILPDGVPLVLRGYVTEADRPKLQQGAVAEVSWNAYPRQKYGFTTGRVTGIASVSSNQYEVLISFSRLELRGESFGVRSLLPGTTAEARAIATSKTALAMLWDWVRGVNP